MIASVIFDLDGTLLDTLADIGESMNEVLAARGLATHPIDEYRHFIGDGIERLVRRSLGGGGQPADEADRVIASFRDVYRSRSTRLTRPYPGIPELLDSLAVRGTPMSVLSNKPHAMTVEVIQGCLGRFQFADVRGAGPRTARKPDPVAGLEQARMMGAAPARTLVLGDSGNDMLMATRARMVAVGARWGFRSAAELSEAGASHLIEHPAELLGLLDAI